MQTIVLLRGLVREARHWGSFPSVLKKETPNLKILTPEIPGVGKHYQTISPSNFDDMIDFMHENVRKDLEGEAIICAVSLGGMIAKRWIERYPKDFKRIILINTSFKGLNPLFKRLRPAAFKTFLQIFSIADSDQREKKVLSLVSNNLDKQKEALPDWQEIQRTAPVARKSYVNQLRAALNYVPITSKPEISLLIIGSIKDKLCSVDSSLKLFDLWGGQLKLHPSAGHDIALDDPDWLAKTIREFIK